MINYIFSTHLQLSNGKQIPPATRNKALWKAILPTGRNKAL
jgi:hypothetical protein